MANTRPWSMALVLLLGCRDLAGVDSKDFTADGSGRGVCSFSSGSGAYLRFVQGAPLTGGFELCLRPEGGAMQALPRGEGCSGPLRYGQRSGAIGLSPGHYRARAVAPEQGCEGAALAEADVDVGEGATREVVLSRGPQGLALAQIDEPPGPGLWLLDLVEGADEVTLEGAGVSLRAPRLRASARAAPTAESPLALTSGATELARIEPPWPVAGVALALGATEEEPYRPRLSLCDDASGPAGCRSSPLPTFTLDTLNNRFNSTSGTAEIEGDEPRLTALVAALINSPADAVCLTEISPLGLREKLAAAVASAFPFPVYFPTSDQTPADFSPQPTSTIPDEPPCAAFLSEIDEAIACAAKNCSTIPGSSGGTLTNEVCFLDACGGDLAKYYKDFPSRVCASCLRTAFSNGTMAQARERCTAQPGLPLRYNGENDMLLLSRHPVEGAERLVLPSSGTRRVLLRAPVFKPGGPPVDVFCTRLGTVFEGIQYVYVGLYGEGSKGQEGWAAEQRLQAELVAKTVQLRFRGRPSLLAGWMGASREVKEDSKLVIEGFNEKTLAEFGLLLQNASTPQQMAVCTACRANPLYNDSLLDRRTDHVFLRGLTLDDVASMDLAYNANNVVVTPSAATRGESLVPISDHYGLRVQVQLAR